tara:strand:- start:116 stop:433 length:318 start_codon:yes stop_codon:yes gene_type:complete
MTFYIKAEKFNNNGSKLNNEERRKYIAAHISWVEALIKSGINVSTGYLVDKDQIAGGGGLLLLNARSYREAMEIIKNDPMIVNKLVNWTLHEWKIIEGSHNLFTI